MTNCPAILVISRFKPWLCMGINSLYRLCLLCTPSSDKCMEGKINVIIIIMYGQRPPGNWPGTTLGGTIIIMIV